MNIVMNGALGRMGTRILSLALDDPAFTITGAVDVNEDMHGRDIGELIGAGRLDVPVCGSLTDALDDAEVVIDFTWPGSILDTASICGDAGIPLVMGTTGLDPADNDTFAELVSDIPCVFAPNMSVGVNLVFKLAGEIAAALGDEYDIEITEVHHRFKKDAPSGTAKRIAQIITDTLGRSMDKDIRHGREGVTGERTRREIGMHALRIGDVVGEHTVSFGTTGERIELTHRLQSRDALAIGAIRAAKFIIGKSPGIYDMQDVLGLK